MLCKMCASRILEEARPSNTVNKIIDFLQKGNVGGKRLERDIRKELLGSALIFPVETPPCEKGELFCFCFTDTFSNQTCGFQCKFIFEQDENFSSKFLSASGSAQLASCRSQSRKLWHVWQLRPVEIAGHNI